MQKKLRQIMKAVTSKMSALENLINKHLASLPAHKRPELSTRRRAQSVAYQARQAFQATDIDGNVETVTVEAALAWLDIK